MISVVTPIFNEQENLPELLRRVTKAMDGVDEAWEFVLVDDGSQDASPRLLAEAAAVDERLKVVSLSRNFGHQPAVTAGIHHAVGDCVVLIDGDLQDPPEVIPKLIDAWRGGAEVVLAERTSRAETGARGLGFKLFYPIFRRISDLPNAPDAGIFGLMDRRVVEEFNRLPERNRFIPGLRTWLGFKQASVQYDRADRAAGEPKQTFKRLFKYAMNATISFSDKPLRAATWLGFSVSVVAFMLTIYYLIDVALNPAKIGQGFTTIVICVLFLGGVQLISIGVLGEYIGRIYEELKQRPLYVVRDRINVDAPERRAAGRRGDPSAVVR